MNAIALNYCNLPDIDQDSHFRSPPALVASPWNSVGASSGSYQNIPRRVNQRTGLSSWLEHILYSADEYACSLTTPEIPGALAEIRDAFSLNTVQIAQALGVSRQATYDWADGRPAKVENRQRIATICDFARQWRELYPSPMGPIVSETINGTSLLDLLKANSLDSSAITALFPVIAAKLVESDANRPPSARELAAKYGMQPVSEGDHRRNLQNALLRARRGR